MSGGDVLLSSELCVCVLLLPLPQSAAGGRREARRGAAMVSRAHRLRLCVRLFPLRAQLGVQAGFSSRAVRVGHLSTCSTCSIGATYVHDNDNDNE